MKKYMVYMDDGKNCFKLAIPADSVKSAKKFVQGNGEVLKVSDITEDYPISAEKVANALKDAEFNQVEIDLIIRTLTFHNIAE